MGKRWTCRPQGANWGDFGDDDQIGKMNLLTPAIRAAAVREIVEGEAFCLSLPLDYPGGSGLVKSRKPPRLFAVRREIGVSNYNFPWSVESHNCDHLDVTSDDAVTLFTQYSTQWDALSHYGQIFDRRGDGTTAKVFYNGYAAEEDIFSPASEDDSPRAAALGIENLATAGVQGRGTLVDLFSTFGEERAAVGYDDLMRIMDEQKVEVKVGDFLCLYTGFADVVLGMGKSPDTSKLHGICAGLDGSDEQLLNWISESGIVAIVADNTAVENRPTRRPTGPRTLMPLHSHCLFKQGIHLGELWYLKDLAAWLRRHQRCHFFLTAPPLRLPGSVGSPCTPIATV